MSAHPREIGAEMGPSVMAEGPLLRANMQYCYACNLETTNRWVCKACYATHIGEPLVALCNRREYFPRYTVDSPIPDDVRPYHMDLSVYGMDVGL